MGRKTRDAEVSYYLGKGVTCEGSLTFNGQARFDGEFKGNIQGQGTVVVGPTAELNADIQARNIIISGHVTGNVVASERLELKKPGKLSGDVSAPLVVMEEGVLFEGNCRMAGEEGQDAEGGLKLLAGSPS